MSRTKFLYHGTVLGTRGNIRYNYNGGLFEGNNLRATPQNTLWLSSFLDVAVHYAAERAQTLLRQGYGDVTLYVFRVPRRDVGLVEDLKERWEQRNHVFSGFRAGEILLLRNIERWLTLYDDADISVKTPERRTRRSNYTWECYDIPDGALADVLAMPFEPEKPSRDFRERFKGLSRENAWVNF